jgi:uridine kinase
VGIAERIAALPHGRRIVFVAGPSSSGKTTFAKRLALQLRVLGLEPRALSLDDYFKDREATPRDEKGDYDFESLQALQLDRLAADLSELLDGGIVTPPRFDFHAGLSVDGDAPLSLDPDAPLIVEGIHALNPELAPGLPRDRSLGVYVSALTNTNVDAFTPTRTNIVRLFRRLVRDSQYRGYTASETLLRWSSVRDGEQKHIFPHQGNADVFFNSGLAYELGVLKLWAEPRLAAVPPHDPAYGKARSLLELTGLHLPIDARLVPPTSLLREFIGGSGFSY